MGLWRQLKNIKLACHCQSVTLPAKIVFRHKGTRPALLVRNSLHCSLGITYIVEVSGDLFHTWSAAPPFVHKSYWGTVDGHLRSDFCPIYYRNCHKQVWFRCFQSVSSPKLRSIQLQAYSCPYCQPCKQVTLSVKDHYTLVSVTPPSNLQTQRYDNEPPPLSPPLLDPLPFFCPFFLPTLCYPLSWIICISVCWTWGGQCRRRVAKWLWGQVLLWGVGTWNRCQLMITAKHYLLDMGFPPAVIWRLARSWQGLDSVPSLEFRGFRDYTIWNFYILERTITPTQLPYHSV